YRCAKACATSSPARLLAAYGEIGSTAAASSLNGAGVVSPYTDDDEPNTTRPIPARRAASSTRTVPVTFVSLYDAGSSSEGRTPGRAARCTTTDTPSSGSGSRTMSASTKRNP